MLLRGAQPPTPASADPSPPIGTSAVFASELDLDWIPLVETTDPRYGSMIQLVDGETAVVVLLPSESGEEPGGDAEVAYPDA